MRRLWALGFIAALALSGCAKKGEGFLGGLSWGASHGRYVGAGLYPAGRMWQQIVHPTGSKDPAAAQAQDDEQIIVVVDSKTGEVRQCGNVTGYCIGMSPWAAALPATQSAPVPLGKHADALDQQALQAQSVARR